MASPIAVALDLPERDRNLALVESLAGRVPYFKVGLRMLFEEPDTLIGAIHAAGAELFIDAKLYDIPATVRGAARALGRWSPSLLTVHAAGGAAMVAAAVEGLLEAGVGSPRVIAVTRLTSQTLDAGDAAALASELASALEGGAVGGVCSALEVRQRKLDHPNTYWVTPGIRPAGAQTHDQTRVATPAQALREGADLLVIGRPITHAPDPVAAWEEIERSIQAGS